MALYTNQSGKLKEVKEKHFKLEKDIQNIFEANLYSIMGFEFVKSEFTIKNKRIDTLAYDSQSCAFIIIEYKRDKNITDIAILKKSLKLFINAKAGQLDDPKYLAQDVSNTGHWGKGDYQIQVEYDKDLEYIMSLVKQVIV